MKGGQSMTVLRRGPKPADKQAKKKLAPNAMKGGQSMTVLRRGPKPADKQAKKKLAPNAHEKSLLMTYLATKAHEQGETPADLAKHLGIGYVYLTQLLSGKKSTANIGREILVAAAKYMKVPVIQAYLWAGALKPSDFIYEVDNALIKGNAYDVMSRNQVWGGFMPSQNDWESAPSELKQLVVRLFEENTGQTIIDKNLRPHIPPESVPKKIKRDTKKT
jgi:transcriptional regulator with XRE-family HTH domain